MAVSNIKNRKLILENFNVNITWPSSSTPSWASQIDITKDGYRPVALCFNIGGSGGANVFGQARILNEANPNQAYCTAKHIGTPSSLTGNVFRLTVTYEPI